MTTVIECHPPVAAKACCGPQRRQGQAAGSLVVRRLRHRRLDLGDRRRTIGGGDGLACRPDSARRRCGQRQCHIGRRRRGCEVTSTDYVESLLALGRKRAEAERLQVKFQFADAEDLPFAGASFDAVVSTFGGMFSPDRIAPLLKWCGCAGPVDKSALANWTPESFVGQMFQGDREVPPPPTAIVAGGMGYAEWVQTTLAPRRPPRTLSRATSPFAIARRSTSSTSSASIMDRCTRPLRRSMRPAAKRSLAISSFSSDNSIPPVTRPWSFRASTWRLSSPGDESPGAAAAGKGSGRGTAASQPMCATDVADGSWIGIRGEPLSGSAPPTPPYVRARIRRIEKLR